jgi:hypothetical protein
MKLAALRGEEGFVDPPPAPTGHRDATETSSVLRRGADQAHAPTLPFYPDRSPLVGFLEADQTIDRRCLLFASFHL